MAKPLGEREVLVIVDEPRQTNQDTSPTTSVCLEARLSSR